MSEPRPTDKIPLTILLSPELAARLKMAAETQKRPPSDVAADLLNRHLPRPRPQGDGPKTSIPYL